MDLISVIVPIYNVEKYLKKSIESIINQTYKNIEIILVNDGSNDSSKDICDYYREKDSRIIVIYQENMGLSEARNTGIEISKGEYILLIDSDDFIDKNMISILYSELKQNNADISICKYQKVKENEEISKKNSDKRIIINSKKDLYENQEKDFDLYTVVWNKLYKKDLFKEIRYPSGKIHEDLFVTYKLLYAAKKIVLIDEYLYAYVQRSGSIMDQKYSKNRLNRLDALYEQIEFYSSKNEWDFWFYVIGQYRRFLIEAYIKTKRNKKDYKNDLKKYKKLYNEQIKKNIKINFRDFKKNRSYLFYYRLPGLYMLLMKKYR